MRNINFLVGEPDFNQILLHVCVKVYYDKSLAGAMEFLCLGIQSIISQMNDLQLLLIKCFLFIKYCHPKRKAKGKDLDDNFPPAWSTEKLRLGRDHAYQRRGPPSPFPESTYKPRQRQAQSLMQDPVSSSDTLVLNSPDFKSQVALEGLR